MVVVDAEFNSIFIARNRCVTDIMLFIIFFICISVSGTTCINAKGVCLFLQLRHSETD